MRGIITKVMVPNWLHANLLPDLVPEAPVFLSFLCLCLSFKPVSPLFSLWTSSWLHTAPSSSFPLGSWCILPQSPIASPWHLSFIFHPAHEFWRVKALSKPFTWSQDLKAHNRFWRTLVWESEDLCSHLDSAAHELSFSMWIWDEVNTFHSLVWCLVKSS